MLRIWGRKNSINVQKAMWAVGELGLSHQRIDAGGPFGGLETAEFRTMNPNKRIPVIDDGGTVVWESHAIVRYLAIKYGAGTLAPEDPGERAKSDMWTDWTLADLQPAFTGGVFWNFYRTPENKRDWPLIRRSVARCAALFQLLDRHLEGREFLAGDRLTFGDIPAGAQLYRYFNIDIERPTLPNVKAWYERLTSREPYRMHVMVPFDDLKGRLSF
jgi:glutathione S-transferase